MDENAVELDAMFAWSSMHGLATMLESNAVEHLDLRPDTAARVAPHAMAMIDVALMRN